MAAKKASESTKDAATTTKAGTKKAGVKKTPVKKATKAKAETATKSGTPKAAKKPAAKAAAPAAAPAPKKAAAAKKAPVKLNDRQLEFLKKIKDSGEAGYSIGQKVEQRTIEALQDRKLLKKGPKNKETGKHHYMLTKAGEKHLTTSGTPEGGAGSTTTGA